MAKSETVCRGCIRLGTGCRRCSRCKAELERIKCEESASADDAFQMELPMFNFPSPPKKPLSEWTYGEKMEHGIVSLEAWHGPTPNTCDGSMSVAADVIQAGTDNPPFIGFLQDDEPVDTKPGSVTGLPVKGYKPTQEDWKIALVNQNKVLEEKILRQIDFLATGPYVKGLNQRDIQMARGMIEDAFMRLNRGVFQPQRLDGDL